MRVESREGNIETTLTSDPPLPEDEVASLMLSGQRTPSGSAGEVVTSQLMQALSGEIVGTVGRAIGFDAVRVESGNPADLLLDPTLLSIDNEPGAAHHLFETRLSQPRGHLLSELERQR